MRPYVQMLTALLKEQGMQEEEVSVQIAKLNDKLDEASKPFAPGIITLTLASTLERFLEFVIRNASPSSSVSAETSGMARAEQIRDLQPSDKAMQFAQQIAEHANEAWVKVQSSGLIGGITQDHASGVVTGEDGKGVLPEMVAGLIARNAAQWFSSEAFKKWFEEWPLAGGWTLKDALAEWYSLANLALVISLLEGFQREG